MREMLRPVLRGASAALGGWSRPVLGAAAESPGKSLFLQIVRGYARPVQKRKHDIPSHLDDLPPTMLQKDYANVSVIDKVDNVVRRILSLEMASQKEKVKVKKEQLADKVRKTPEDQSSIEVRVAYLTARIQTLKEHLHFHPKDKVNLRNMLMAIDRRNLLLKYLRNNCYDIFENTCRQLEIEYTIPPQYRWKVSRRSAIKKDLRARVFQEKQKLRALERLREVEGPVKAAKAPALPEEGSPV